VTQVRVLVLDASARQSLAACRSLGRAGYDVGAAGYGPTALAGYSRYTSRYHELPSPFGSESAFAEALEAVVHGCEYAAVLATDDATLARLNGHLPLVPTVPALGEPFARLTDKLSLAWLCGAHGVDYPDTYPAGTVDELAAAVQATGFPAIVKAERSAVARSDGLGWLSGAYVARDQATVDEAFAALTSRGLRPIVQRRVQWTEKINAAVVRRDGRSELRYAHRVLREIPPEGGMGVAMETLAPDDPSAAVSLAALEAVCDGAGYEGIAQAELYLGDGRAWLLDVNPRLWGSTWFAERLGLRVSERALRAVLGEPPLADAVYEPGRRFHHVPHEWRWISRQPPAWRSLLAVGRATRPGDLFEYVDWTDVGTLMRYAYDKAAARRPSRGAR
jgi:predicted ATP-grasp superfamily ATP-dependent carboligase